MKDDDNVLSREAKTVKVKLAPELRAQLLADGYSPDMLDNLPEVKVRAGETRKAFLLRNCREIVDESAPDLSRSERRRLAVGMVKQMLRHQK